MINIRIMDETIDPAGLHRQVALQVNDIKTMIADVSDNDDQYRRLFIAIRMVPQLPKNASVLLKNLVGVFEEPCLK